MKKRGQVTIEFVLVCSAVVFLVTIMIASTNFNTALAREKNEQEALNDFANYVQQEIIIASQMHSNYTRIFVMPLHVIGKDYTVNTYQNYFLVVNTSKFVANRGIPLLDAINRNMTAGHSYRINKTDAGITIQQI